MKWSPKSCRALPLPTVDSMSRGSVRAPRHWPSTRVGRAVRSPPSPPDGSSARIQLGYSPNESGPFPSPQLGLQRTPVAPLWHPTHQLQPALPHWGSSTHSFHVTAWWAGDPTISRTWYHHLLRGPQQGFSTQTTGERKGSTRDTVSIY